MLRALCRPSQSGAAYTEPASIREIAAELFVSEAAVKQHLLRLYDKFKIYRDEPRRRVRLANEALRLGLIADEAPVDAGSIDSSARG